MTVCNLCLFRSRPATCCSTRRRRCHPTVLRPNLRERRGAAHRQHRHSAPYWADISAGRVERNAITVNAGDRTSNYCEAWNWRFETLVSHLSPSVWTTLEVLGDDATMLVRHVQQWQTGAASCAELSL